MKFTILKKLKHIRLNIVSIIFGILFSMYFIIVSINWGRADTFNIVMIFLGLFWIIITINVNKIFNLFGKFPRIIKIFFKIVLLSFLLSFVIVECIIIQNMRTTAAASADYVIVLGCQVDGSIPSIPLLRRVNTALNYLKVNQNTNVVISGGQGPWGKYY